MVALIPMTTLAISSPLSEPQWQQVQQLLRSLDQRQTMWLSGYLAAGPQAQEAVPATASGPSVLIAHGGETGNCQSLAMKLADQARTAGVIVDVVDLAQLKLRQLAKREHLVLICSTHGDGDPPEPILAFYEAIMADNAPRLSSLKFSVLALGDSSYEHFCVTGQQLDERLEALGATRVHARVDCDVDFAEPASVWSKALLAKLPRNETAQASSAAPVEAQANAVVVDKRNPISVEVLENLCLSEASRVMPIHHIELALEMDGFNLSPGDAVGILADNPPALVAAVLNACGLSGEAAVSVNEQSLPLVQALRQHLDLTVPSGRFLTFWAGLSANAQLLSYADVDHPEHRAYLKRMQVLDLITLAPATPEPQALVDALRPLQPRLYDVANSLSAIPDELHLNVKDYRYAFGNRTESGIASRYLLTLEPGDSVRLYPHRNARFHLPEEAQAPVIFIGEGTGIAPYRAFVQEMQHGHQTRQAWLVFSENYFEQDFLYQSEWQQAHASGVLEKIDAVFYQDHPGATLATPLLKQIETLQNWLDQGAHVYFCGDKEQLTLCEKSLAEHIGNDAWKLLSKDKRIHRNLY